MGTTAQVQRCCSHTRVQVRQRIANVIARLPETNKCFLKGIFGIDQRGDTLPSKQQERCSMLVQQCLALVR
jgi:hypothetical protein